VTAIHVFGNLICDITLNNKPACEFFSNVESFSAILKCFHRSKTSNDALWIAASINNILYDVPSSNKFLNALPVVEAFSFIIPFANGAGAVGWILEALLKILRNNEEAQKLFATPEFFQIFQGMENLATDDYSKIPFRSVLELVNPN
jgi:hypothetical protein